RLAVRVLCARRRILCEAKRMIGKICLVGMLGCGMAVGQISNVPGTKTSVPAGASLHAMLLHPDGPLPAYEVATIKPWASGKAGYPIRTYIGWAYGVPFGSGERIVGGPDWINKQQY